MKLSHVERKPDRSQIMSLGPKLKRMQEMMQGLMKTNALLMSHLEQVQAENAQLRWMNSQQRLSEVRYCLCAIMS